MLLGPFMEIKHIFCKKKPKDSRRKVRMMFTKMVALVAHMVIQKLQVLWSEFLIFMNDRLINI